MNHTAEVKHKGENGAQMVVGEHKLSPQHLLARSLEIVPRYSASATESLGRIGRRHPLPLVFAGLAAASWFLTKPKSTSRDADYVSGEGQVFQEWPGNPSEERGHPAGENGQAQSQVSGVESGIRELRVKSKWLKRGLDRMAYEQPLLLGALGLAMGAAIGAALPESEPERRWLGPMRDQTLNQIKDEGKNAYAQLHDTAQRGVDVVKQAVADAAAGK